MIEGRREKLLGARFERLAGLGSRLRRRAQETRRLWTPGAVADGRIDSPESGASLGGEIELRGWAMFPSGASVRVDCWLGDLPLGRARLGLPRPDVREGTGLAAAAISGFELAADLTAAEVEVGATELRIVATGPRGERFELGPVALCIDEEPLTAAPREDVLAAPARHTPRAPDRPGHHLLAFTHRLDLGGAQLYLFELIRELLRLEVANPTVVTSVDGPLRPLLEELGVPVHVSSPLPTYDRGAHLGRIEELAFWAEDRGFEMAMVNTASPYAFPGAEVAARLGIPALWAIHESYRPRALWSDLDPHVMALAEAALADAALAIFEAESTMRLYEGRIPARCLTLPYGIDLDCIAHERERLDRLEQRRRLGVPADADVVLCLGTIEPRKGQAPLAQAFSSIAVRHPRAHLVLVGGWGDAASTALADYIGDCVGAERITLVPLTADVQPWHAVADILACPSDLESLPRAVLEAMAWGKPVLATDVFGLPDVVVDGKTGWLCSPCDVEELARALERALASTPAERAALGKAGRALVERDHSFDAYARKFAGLLDRLAEGGDERVSERVPVRVSVNGSRSTR